MSNYNYTPYNNSYGRSDYNNYGGNYAGNDDRNHAALEKQARALEALVKDQEITIQTLTNNKNELENSVFDLQKQVKELQKDDERFKGSSTSHNDRDGRMIEELNSKCYALEKELSQLQIDASGSSDTIDSLRREISELREGNANNERASQEINALKDAKGRSDREIEQLKKLVEAHEHQRSSYATQSAASSSNSAYLLVEKEKQIATLRAETDDLKGQLSELQFKVRQAQQKEVTNQNVAQEIQRKAELEANVRALTEQNTRMRSEIEHVIKVMNQYKTPTQTAFFDNLINVFKSIHEPVPTVASTPTSYTSPPPSYHQSSPSYASNTGASPYPSTTPYPSPGGNPPYYPNTSGSTPYYPNTNVNYTNSPSSQYSPSSSQYSPAGTSPYTNKPQNVGGVGAGSALGANMRTSGGPSSVPIKIPALVIPVFFSRNSSDLPDIIDVLTEEGKTMRPILKFKLEDYANVPDGGNGKLAVVLAMCGTDRVDVVDKDLLDNLREKKGYADVLMIVLRRGNDPSKFKANHDITINSGVNKDKMLFQLLYFKEKLLQAECNTTNISKFFELAKKAFPNVQ